MRREGFTLVEVALAALLAALVLWVTMDLWMTGRRGAQAVTTSLEVNEANLTTFRKLARDLRGARDVLHPPLAPADAEEPGFAWEGPGEGTHVLEVGRFRLRVLGERLVPEVTHVRWYLDDPVDLPGGDGAAARSFSLYREARAADAAAGEAPRRERIAEGIRELVFFRRERDEDAPDPDAGARNVKVRMRTARSRSGGRGDGYGATLRTTVHLRGAP